MLKKILYNISIAILLVAVFCSCRRDERGLVVGKIKEASDLATVEFTIDKIVHGTKSKRLFWVVKLSESRFLAYSQAIIKTGIDLGELQKEDIEIDKDQISIVLPHVRVINFSYPAEKFRIDSFVTNNAFLNTISLENQEEFFRQAELDIRNNLQFMGLRKTTETKTRVLMETMLKNLGYREVYISFKEGPLIEEININEEES